MALPREPMAIPGEQPSGRGTPPPRGGVDGMGQASRKVCLLTGPECFRPRTPGPPSPGAWLSPWASTPHRAVGASLVQQVGAEDKA